MLTSKLSARPATLALTTLLTVGCVSFAPSESRAQTANPSEAMLATWLKRFPAADTNKDGKLTAEEAKAFYGKVAAQRNKTTQSKGYTIAPDLKNEKYGPAERNVLDFWYGKDRSAPAPLIVYIHGGGFVGGDKSNASADSIKKSLQGGAAFMSINYRFRDQAPIQDILRDAARAIQYVRANAEKFNIDPKRIASFGASAGAGTSLWLAAHDDLADPKASDPVLRQSSRLAAAASLNGQATYDLKEWDREVYPFKPEWRASPNEGAQFYHFASEADYDTAAGKKIMADCSMLSLLTSDDPPIYLSCSQPDGEPTNRGHLLHHPKHAKIVEERCKSLGISVAAYYTGLTSSSSSSSSLKKEEENPVDFLLRNLTQKVATVAK